ncbi:MAG: metallophosphoesterase [Pirellulales bacterium]
MAEEGYSGLLIVGDPHVEGRQPGFRKDDYPNVILDKLAWCVEYARQHRLLLALLGDLFDKPRDNPNWLLNRLFHVLQTETIGVFGNHDVHYNPELTEHDSVSLLVNTGRLRLVSADSPWDGTIGGRRTIVGGASYRQEIPTRFDATIGSRASPLVIWLTHHDILIPGYDDGRIAPHEIPGVEIVVNGHIHRRLSDVQVGSTLWLTPGNISRRSRSDAAREHIPSALRIDVSPMEFTVGHVEVPHRPFEEVFHEAVIEFSEGVEGSAFIAGLAELQTRRTASGEGLQEFLRQNVGQFESDVATEILMLAKEVADA